MSKKFVRLLLFLGIFAFIIWISIFGRVKNTDLYIEEIRKQYKGVIVEIYYDRAMNLKIKTEKGGFVSVGMLSGKLANSAMVGDSIEKVANENYVRLSRSGKRLRIPYLHIPESIRDNNNWPEEWRNKWPESTY